MATTSSDLSASLLSVKQLAHEAHFGRPNLPRRSPGDQQDHKPPRQQAGTGRCTRFVASAAGVRATAAPSDGRSMEVMRRSRLPVVEPPAQPAAWPSTLLLTSGHSWHNRRSSWLATGRLPETYRKAEPRSGSLRGACNPARGGHGVPFLALRPEQAGPGPKRAAARAPRGVASSIARGRETPRKRLSRADRKARNGAIASTVRLSALCPLAPRGTK